MPADNNFNSSPDPMERWRQRKEQAALHINQRSINKSTNPLNPRHTVSGDLSSYAYAKASKGVGRSNTGGALGGNIAAAHAVAEQQLHNERLPVLRKNTALNNPIATVSKTLGASNIRKNAEALTKTFTVLKDKRLTENLSKISSPRLLTGPTASDPMRPGSKTILLPKDTVSGTATAPTLSKSRTSFDATMQKTGSANTGAAKTTMVGRPPMLEEIGTKQAAAKAARARSGYSMGSFSRGAGSGVMMGAALMWHQYEGMRTARAGAALGSVETIASGKRGGMTAARERMSLFDMETSMRSGQFTLADKAMGRDKVYAQQREQEKFGKFDWKRDVELQDRYQSRLEDVGMFWYRQSGGDVDLAKAKMAEVLPHVKNAEERKQQIAEYSTQLAGKGSQASHENVGLRSKLEGAQKEVVDSSETMEKHVDQGLKLLRDIADNIKYLNPALALMMKGSAKVAEKALMR